MAGPRRGPRRHPGSPLSRRPAWPPIPPAAWSPSSGSPRPRSTSPSRCWEPGPTASTTSTASWSRSTSRTGCRSPSLPPGGGDTLHVAGYDPGPSADNLVLRAIAAARRAARPEWGRPEPPPPLAARLEKRIPVAAGLAGGSSDAAAAADAALEAWGVTLDPGRAAPARGGAGLGRAVLPGRRPGAGRGTRRAHLRRCPGCGTPTGRTTVPGCCSSRPRAGSPRRRPSGPGTRAPGSWAARPAWRRLHLAEELRNGRLRVADLLARASVLAAANDLAPAAADRGARARAVQAGAAAAPGPAGRHLRLRAHPLGALSFACRGGGRRGGRPRGPSPPATCPHPGPREPFVAATRILSTTHAGPTSADQHRREP